MAVESRVAPNCVGLLATRRVFDSLAWELMRDMQRSAVLQQCQSPREIAL